MIEEEIKQILLDLGEDPEREGLLKTPARVRKSLEFLTRGYKQDIEKVINENPGNAELCFNIIDESQPNLSLIMKSGKSKVAVTKSLIDYLTIEKALTYRIN